MTFTLAQYFSNSRDPIAVSASPFGRLQRQCSCGGEAGPDGECEACRTKRLGFQRSPASSAPLTGAPPIVDRAVAQPGVPLPQSVRASMEPRFRHSFADVRIHTDSLADASARAVSAHAYTVGRQIVFRSGRYQPMSRAGRNLLAHELTHVVQQSKAGFGGAESDWAWETEAARAATQVTEGRQAGKLSPGPAGSVQRQDEEGANGAPDKGPAMFDPKTLSDQRLFQEYRRVLHLSEPETEDYFLELEYEIKRRNPPIIEQGKIQRPGEILVVPNPDNPGVLIALVIPAGKATAEVAAFAQTAVTGAGATGAVTSGTAVTTGVGAETAGAAATAGRLTLGTVAFFLLVLTLPFTLKSDSPVPEPEPQPQPAPQPKPSPTSKAQPETQAEPQAESKPETKTKPDPKTRKRQCRIDPCPQPLPIAWPAELPLPENEQGLIRTRKLVRENEVLGGRTDVQRKFAEEIDRARFGSRQPLPPPTPCDPAVEHDDSRWNAPYDAHHKHPLYLGGQDIRRNLCALEADKHQRGHPRLDNQTQFLAEYMECGICSGFLSHHPDYQTYYILMSK